MSWPRNDPDPFEERRRKLAEQERLVAEQMSLLNKQLYPSGEPAPPPAVKPTEPPVWRMEEETRPVDPTPVRKRHLARQRQRDMMLFFIAVGILFIVMSILVWVACVHNNAPSSGL